jgi:hypothetical protein
VRENDTAEKVYEYSLLNSDHENDNTRIVVTESIEEGNKIDAEQTIMM